ncbi:MAG: methyltransferase domain-containing protein [Mariprofundales bacterium]
MFTEEEIEINYAIARRNMVDYQIRCCKVLDPEVLGIFRDLPREDFLPANVRSIAYMEGHVPLPVNQEMLSPLQEASILQALSLHARDRVLDIGAGCGFLTTAMSLQAGEVIAYELHPELATLAKRNIAEHGINHIELNCGNGMDGEQIQQLGTFDAIVLEAALDKVPEYFFDMLNDGGCLMAFIGTNPIVTLEIYENIAGSLRRTSLFETMLLDMEGLPAVRQFVF